MAALAFQFASTNLVWELGLVLWVLIGWQFTLGEYAGGIVMIVLMTVLLRLFVSRQREEQAREHAREADAGHQHHLTGEQLSWRERLTSARAWSDVAQNFRGDWQMLWKKITIGFLLAGYIAQFGNGFFEHLFIRHARRRCRQSRTSSSARSSPCSASSARSATSRSPRCCDPAASASPAYSRFCSPI